LSNTLVKNGWSKLQKGDEAWLVKGNYHIKMGEITYSLYCNVMRGNSLILLVEQSYGRRQSQSINRAVAKHERETRRCISTHFNLKGERRR
jgi:hypothetical protein